MRHRRLPAQLPPQHATGRAGPVLDPGADRAGPGRDRAGPGPGVTGFLSWLAFRNTLDCLNACAWVPVSRIGAIRAGSAGIVKLLLMVLFDIVSSIVSIVLLCFDHC